MECLEREENGRLDKRITGIRYARQSEEMQLKQEKGVPFFYFPILEQTGLVTHAFSTRLGGVSRGCYATMNLSRTRGDEESCVTENYRRMADALGVEMESMVLSYQTHTTNIRKVTAEDAGKGVVRERDYTDIDGLITNVPGITLVTFYADCVPLYFVDPVNKAVGLSHSGWRGTVNRMGKHTLEAMRREYGTKPEDVLACIGPSICKDCFEVGEEVAEAFMREFPQKMGETALTVPKTAPGKYLVDLWGANQRVLLEAGVLPEHLAVTNVCTQCNPDLLFSHRVMGTARGNLCAFLGLKANERN